MDSINLHTSLIHSLLDDLYMSKKISIDVLRLDLVHPIVSGNKWFKLKEYIREAQEQEKDTILTFGGAYSNHIVATAAACNAVGLKSIGLIRGEKPSSCSPTLEQASSLGMQLVFVDRNTYSRKQVPDHINIKNVYVVNEGGYGIKAAKGAATILDLVDQTKYTHVITAVGTGTTLAGIVEGSTQQECIGISVLKNNYSLQAEINALLFQENKNRFTLIHDYHFGGYAKKTDGLINFMNSWFARTNIPSDFVYTAKLFFALDDLIKKNYFPEQSRLLAIHSGGLQGNRSLQKGTLIFGD